MASDHHRSTPRTILSGLIIGTQLTKNGKTFAESGFSAIRDDSYAPPKGSFVDLALTAAPCKV